LGKVTDAGFDIKQFAFIFNDIDDPLQPSNSKWIAAVDRLSKQAVTVFNTV
jgi:hypothetical protein